MRIKKWIRKLVYGKHDMIIEELTDAMVQLKKKKQEEMDRTNKYWKTKMSQNGSKNTTP